MARRSGLQAEVVASLGVVMLLATSVLGLVLTKYLQERHAAREAHLRALLARTLQAELRGGDPAPELPFDFAWWRVAADGTARAGRPESGEIDSGSRALAQEARDRGLTLLHFGPVTEPARLATPLSGGGEVAVLRLPAGAAPRPLASPGWVIGALLAADAAVFTVLGAALLRRRAILPLRRLAEAARRIAAGDLSARSSLEASRELAEVGAAFNHMAGSLESRTRALETAVRELRASNRDLRCARAGLDRAERLAAVGTLAAGVAHEVGNPMGALLAFLDLVSRDPGLGDASRRHLGQAREQGERVRAILRQLLDFSRPPRGARAPVDLASAARETAALIEAQGRYAGLEAAVRLEGHPPPALADRAVVSQILLNLLLNAAEAVRGREGPRVELRVRPAALERRAGEDAVGGASERREADAVECRIADNGPGVDPADCERIFDPFFTTKAPGEGTGLGLANAARLAQEMGGCLELVEGAGPGAVFSLRLPAATRTQDGGTGVRGGGRTASPEL